jgi:hypothetical protein
VLADVLDTFRPLHTPDAPLVDRVRVAHRITDIVPSLPGLELEVGARVERFVSRLARFEDLLKQNAIAASDVQMSTSTVAGVWFAVREVGIALPLQVRLLYGVESTIGCRFESRVFSRCG